MPTAPTLVYAGLTATTSATSVTSGSITFSSGDVCTVVAFGAGGAANATVNTPTTTLAGQSWTALQSITAGSPAAHCEGRASTFTASTGGSGTVTTTSTSEPSNNVDHFVWVHRNASAATVGRSTSAVSSSRTLAYTPSQADSAMIWGSGDWSASTVQTATPTSTSHTSASPGPTAVPQGAVSASQYTYQHQVLDDQTGTGSVSYGVLGSGTGPFTIMVVEVQGTGGAPAIPPELIMAPRQA